MGAQSRDRPLSQLPAVLLATSLVVVFPMVVVLWMRSSGQVTSVWVGTAIGVAASLLASQAGAALWKRSDSDMLFSDLMLWGWLQRWRAERRLSEARGLLGLTPGSSEALTGSPLSKERKAALLTQLTTSLEAGDHYTSGHSRRVARHAGNIARRMGLPRDQVAKIRAAGAMHDVGKLHTPIEVLHKDGRLTDEEFDTVKRHPGDGADMAAILGDDELTAIIRHHHERLDGTGYPDGLAGDAIPLGARILAVADTFDAITSTRPYRHAAPHKKALDILTKETGTQLDPDAVRAFQGCYSGRRPLAYWTVLLNGRPRLAAWLGAGLSPANAGAMVNVAATAATVAAVGGAVLSPVVAASPEPSRTVADSAATTVPAPLRPVRQLTSAARDGAGRHSAGDHAGSSADHSRTGVKHGGKDGASKDESPGGSRSPAAGTPRTPSSPGSSPGSKSKGTHAPSAPTKTPAAGGGGEPGAGTGTGGNGNGNAGGGNSGQGQGNGNAGGGNNGQGKGKGNAGGGNSGQGKGNGNAGGGNSGQGKGNGNAGGGNSGQGNSGQGNSGQGNSGQGKGNSGQGKANGNTGHGGGSQGQGKVKGG